MLTPYYTQTFQESNQTCEATDNTECHVIWNVRTAFKPQIS